MKVNLSPKKAKLKTFYIPFKSIDPEAQIVLHVQKCGPTMYIKCLGIGWSWNNLTYVHVQCVFWTFTFLFKMVIKKTKTSGYLIFILKYKNEHKNTRYFPFHSQKVMS